MERILEISASLLIGWGLGQVVFRVCTGFPFDVTLSLGFLLGVVAFAGILLIDKRMKRKICGKEKR